MLTQLEPAALRDVELFQGMSDAEIAEILPHVEEVSVAAGSTIYEAGQHERALYILLEGSVQVDLEVPRVGERLLVDLHPKAVFGEMSFFHAGPHSATVKCVQDARLLRLDRSEFDALLRTGSAAAAKLALQGAEILAARLATTDQWISQLLTDQQDARMRVKWREFRERMTGTLRQPRGIIGVGATL
jgi:CRP-like cAMP-binding protein